MVLKEVNQSGRGVIFLFTACRLTLTYRTLVTLVRWTTNEVIRTLLYQTRVGYEVQFRLLEGAKLKIARLEIRVKHSRSDVDCFNCL